VITDEDAVYDKWGVAPDQIPDLFALVGDRSDGLPGLPGWGVRSASAVLERYGTVEAIPLDEREWDVKVRAKTTLAAALRERRDEALLCRDLSRLRIDLPFRQTTTHLEWLGADPDRLRGLCTVLGDDSVLERVTRWREPSPDRPIP
jgi:5'-3' exonuclease